MIDPEVKQKIITVLTGPPKYVLSESQAFDVADKISALIAEVVAAERARCVRQIRNHCSKWSADCAVDAIEWAPE